MSNFNSTYKEVVGATVGSVDGQTLNFLDGRSLYLGLNGDCCSSSYYTDLKQFNELIGSTLQEIEECDGTSREGLVYDDNGESVSWHFLKFKTDKGYVTIDWRNDSNGYYDGSVEPILNVALGHLN